MSFLQIVRSKIAFMPLLCLSFIVQAGPGNLEAFPRGLLEELEKPGFFTKSDLDKFCLEDQGYFSVGLIDNFGPQHIGSKGTGTLIDISESDGVLIATGLSSLHNFVDCIREKRTFGLYGSARMSLVLSGKPIGNINITSIYIQLDESRKSIVKDVCLFKGYLALEEKLDESSEYGIPVIEDDFKEGVLATFSELKPQFITQKELSDINEGVTCNMLHFPLDSLDRRASSGIIDFKRNFHDMPSFKGTSGAPIFLSKGKILVGVHTGFSEPSDEKYLSYFLPKKDGSSSDREVKIRVVDDNQFEPVSGDEISQAFDEKLELAKPVDFSKKLMFSEFYSRN